MTSTDAARAAVHAQRGHQVLGLPAGTTLRFAVLLMLSVATAALAYSIVLGSEIGWVKAADGCSVLAGPPAALGPGEIPTLADAVEGEIRSRECMRPFARVAGWYLLSGVGGLSLLTALIYWLRPYWTIRRRRLRPLPVVPESEALHRDLAGLCVTAGLTRPPLFLVDPLHGARSGFVFGHARRPRVCLRAGLLTLHQTDPAAFRAIVLHELAHLRNRDVGITELTVAMWRAFLVTGAVPYAVALAAPTLWGGRGFLADWSPNPEGYLLRLALLVLLVYHSRNAVLRSREHEADLRASTWIGGQGMALFLDHPAQAWWRRWTGPHPQTEARSRVLADPARLARPAFATLGITGIGIGLTVGNIRGPFWLLFGTGTYPLEDTLPTVVAAVLMGTVLGVTAWRTAGFLALGGGKPVAYLVPGSALGVGVLLGGAASTLGGWLPPGRPDVLLGAAAFLIVVTLVGWWAVACARCWLDDTAEVRARLLPLTVAPAVLVLFAGASWWFLKGWPGILEMLLEQDRSELAEMSTLFGVFGVVGHLAVSSTPVTLLTKSWTALTGIVLLWAVPVLGIAFRGRSGISVARRAIQIGMLCGLTAALVSAAGTVVLQMTTTALPGQAAIILWLSLLLLPALLAAGVAAALTARLSASLGLMAAYVTIGPVIAGVTLGYLLRGCFSPQGSPLTECVRVPDQIFFAWVYATMTVYVAVLGVPGLGLGAMFRRARRQDVVVVAHRTRRTGYVAAAAVVALALSVSSVSVLREDPGPSTESVAWTEPTPTPDSPQQAAFLVASWYNQGGGSHFERMISAISGYQTGPTATTCAALGTAATAAGRFPRIPDDVAQQTWHALLVLAEEASVLCRTGRTADAWAQIAAGDALPYILSFDLTRAMTVEK